MTVRKPRSDAKLLHLPTDRQAALVQWLMAGHSYVAIRQRLQSSFGIQCSAKCVAKYWAKVVRPIQASKQALRLLTAMEH